MRILVGAIVALALVAGPASAAWEPGPQGYGVATETNVEVPMADGTILRADVSVPTDPRTGAPAAGPFPVILAQTPYGKRGGAVVGGQLASLGGSSPYLTKRGYIQVVADIRGTGSSGGSFDLFEPVQAADGAALVRWAAKLPNSTGEVGTVGASYLGVIQLMTAAAVGPGSPLKAIFPVIPAHQLYRDTVFMGGILDAEFSASYLALTGALNQLNPIFDPTADVTALAALEVDHLGGLAKWQLQTAANVFSGGDLAYDGAYWDGRSPAGLLDDIVANGIPAYLVGGWYDLFQRGTPLNYSGLQNAFRGRPVSAPMEPDQIPTDRYQLRMGPWYHVTAGQGFELERLQLQWFDHWLKGVDTGIDTPNPVHLYDLGSRRWVDTSRWPLDEAAPTALYLGPGGSLASEAPQARGADTLVWTGLSLPCNRATEQWAAGAFAFVLSSAGLPPRPCTEDNRVAEAGPGAATYTTKPFAGPAVLAGPISATVLATSTRPEVQLVATISDVAPDGTSSSLTQGALLGSHRAVDDAASWGALLPHHPFTRAARAPVVPGAVTRYDIEVFPTFSTIDAGHRLRLTLATADTPHLLPTPRDVENLAGGVYQVLHGESRLTVPLAPPSAYGPNAPPTAAAVATPAGQRFRLDGSASVDPDGRVVAHRWSIGRRSLSEASTFMRRFRTRSRVTLTVTDNRGATAATTITLRPRGPTTGVVTIPASVSFCSGCTRLGARGRRIVARVRRAVAGARAVTITGHTDGVGSAATNLALSRRRARSVARVLLRGLRPRPARVRVDGLGERRPVASNRTATGRARNRRVVIRITSARSR